MNEDESTSEDERCASLLAACREALPFGEKRFATRFAVKPDQAAILLIVPDRVHFCSFNEAKTRSWQEKSAAGLRQER